MVIHKELNVYLYIVSLVMQNTKTASLIVRIRFSGAYVYVVWAMQKYYIMELEKYKVHNVKYTVHGS